MPRASVAGEEKAVKFLVIFKPKASWVDDIYLGNMLVEALGQISSMTGAFDFEVIRQGERGASKRSF